MKKFKLLLIILLIFPINILAYSNKIIVGGETIGIEVHSSGIYVVGFYEVNGENIAEKAGFKVGDIITKIDNKKIDNIDSLNNTLTEAKEYKFTINRDSKEEIITMNLVEDNYLIKTGLYVKDKINGIGTLSYIDPNTRVFGSLGHEILESTTLSKFRIKDGYIYKAEVSSIKKSTDGSTGEKNADIDIDTNYGEIKANEINGIFGKYTDNLPNKDLIEVGNITDIKKGPATIKTVIKDNIIEDYNINIISLDEDSNTKNILFEITDDNLLKKTGGIIQGMSGSPIIQNNKIIGVVNYVIIDDSDKGYGIFITKMLEEGDKIS